MVVCNGNLLFTRINLEINKITFSFSWVDGKFHSQYHSPAVGDRLFSVDYANNSLFVVNGPEGQDREVAGYVFDMNTGDVSGKFGTFLDPHDIAVTSDAREVWKEFL
jgi:peptidylamidoglycolate lyase